MPMVDVERLKRSGQKFASGFTPGQKVLSVLGIAGLVLATTMFMKWSSTQSYSPLFSNLSGKDAGDVTSALNGMGVKYKLADGGATVLVPQSKLYQARVDLSAKGLPANTDGYALLDKMGITASEFQQNVTYQRVVQTELAKTIQAIHGVNGATVNLSLPSNDPFAGPDGQKATASVQVDTGGVRLAQEQVQSIVHLVASSVKDLAPDGVSVTDTSGNLLYAPGSDDAFASTQNLSRTLAYDDSVKSQIEAMLAQSLGPGHASVVVNADVDYSKAETDSTTQTPLVDKKGNQLVNQSHHNDTTFVGPAASSTGVLGPNGTPLGNGSSANQNYKSTDHTDQNLVNTTVTKAQSPGFLVKRLSVSAAIDDHAVTRAQLANYQSLIAAAAGIDPTRHDALVVQRVPMDKQTVALAKKRFDTAANPKGASTPLDLMGIVRYLATLLIVALVLFLAWRSIKRAQLGLTPMRVPLDYAALEAAGNGRFFAGELAAQLGTELPAPEARVLEPARSSVEQDVVELIERQPEDVAQTLRSWLADRRS